MFPNSLYMLASTFSFTIIIIFWHSTLNIKKQILYCKRQVISAQQKACSLL